MTGQAARPAPTQGGQEGGIWEGNLCNKIIMRTELPGNGQQDAPTAAGQGQPQPCSSQSQVHSSASLKFQLFHYFHLYPTPQGAELRSDPPGKVQVPAQAPAASSDIPTPSGTGVVTGAGTAGTSRWPQSLGCESTSQHCLHCTESGSATRSWTQGWGFILCF